VKTDTGSESRFLPTPLAFDVPVRGGGGERRNIVMPFGMGKLEWCGYQMVKKVEDIFIRFYRIYERDRHTDRRTDGHRMTAKAALV